MQIIIDISEDLYNRIFDGEMALNTDDKWELEESVRLSVMHGKVLPKSHGRLIDAWALDKEVVNHVHSGDAESSKDCAKFSMMIITAPTIIEADKEGQT